MPSVLTWLDYDAQARKDALKILTLFKISEGRDELGLGKIRDSFADQLFPGTSTIQTRLRYMLFIPWIYKSLEESFNVGNITQDKIWQSIKDKEQQIIQALRQANDHKGTIGINGGTQTASSIYWSGLGKWNIRQKDCSQYEICQETWNPQLPKPPNNFPAKVNFKLRKNEVEFLQKCVKDACPDSLLAYLFKNPVYVKCAFPWEHPQYSKFDKNHKKLLTHAKNFSSVMYGAVLIYNFLLAEEVKMQKRKNKFSNDFQIWFNKLQVKDIENWDLNTLWKITNVNDDKIKEFVSTWVDYVKNGYEKLYKDNNVQKLIRNREINYKGSRSRFKNQKALDQWKVSNGAGLNRLDYRWSTVKQFLADILIKRG